MRAPVLGYAARRVGRSVAPGRARWEISVIRHSPAIKSRVAVAFRKYSVRARDNQTYNRRRFILTEAQLSMQAPSKAKIRVRLAFLSLAVCLGVLAVGAWYLAGLARLGDSMAAREGHAALQGVAGPAQIDEALRQHPSNKFLQMVAMATRTADDTRAAADRLSNEVEQPAIPSGIVLTALSRGELDALRRNLATAQANALALMPRYAELLKTERDTIEKFALSQHVEKETLGKILDIIGKRHAEMTAFTSRMMSARAEFYRAYESLVAVIIAESGSYKVADGQFIFQFPRTVDRYNSAATATAAAARRVGELAEEGKSLEKSQQAAWMRFVNGG